VIQALFRQDELPMVRMADLESAFTRAESSKRHNPVKARVSFSGASKLPIGFPSACLPDASLALLVFATASERPVSRRYRRERQSGTAQVFGVRTDQRLVEDRRVTKSRYQALIISELSGEGHAI